MWVERYNMDFLHFQHLQIYFNQNCCNDFCKNTIMKYLYIFFVLIVFQSACVQRESILITDSQYKQFSGIYPHLAYYNNEGECGTGAVVPWAGRLWVITYGPHFPNGSSDKFYEITPEFNIAR